MILSMTGYGKAEVELPRRRITIELKSLNSKSMDMHTRLMSSLREREIAMRTLVSEQLLRGKVDLYVHETAAPNTETAGVIDEELVALYHQKMNRLGSRLGITTPHSLDTLLSLPGVLARPETPDLTEEDWLQTRQALLQVIEEVNAFRRKEGAALELQLTKNVETIAALLQEVETHEGERVEAIKARIAKGLEEALGNTYDENRFAQEMIFYIEKLDITEEKQRLRQHLSYFTETLHGKPGQGKKLGFIAQEMGREINTLGSKSNHAQMQQIVVKMKDELEQIKEQVLNIL